MFQNKTDVLASAGAPAKLSQRSLQFWAQFDLSIMDAFSKHLAGENLYDRRIRHSQTLESTFKIRIGAARQEQTVSGIAKIYNDFMNREAREGRIKWTDIIRPVFVFRMPNGKLIARQFGQEVPEGAVPHEKELAQKDFDALMKAGFFPLGDHSETFGGAKRTSFEHDLAHLTAFIENPSYMARLRQVYEQRSRHVDFLKKFDISDPYSRSTFGDRMYLFIEGMTVVNQATKTEMLKSLLLNDEMRNRLDDITLEEMENYLSGLPQEKIIQHLAPLLDIADRYFTPLGGAARNPGDRDFFINNVFLGNLFYGLGRERGTRLGNRRLDFNYLAHFQFHAIRLRNVKVSDWFDLAFSETVPPTSELFTLMKDFSSSGFWPEQR